MDEAAARQAAQVLSDARTKRAKIGVLPEDIRPKDEADAYQVQALVQQSLADGFGALAGHKIGCTTPVMQSYLGIDNPCAGGVYDPATFRVEGAYSFDDLLHPGVECEVAAMLGSDLPPSGAPYDRASVAGAVDSVMASIEVVDDRWHDYKAIDTPSLIADDFFGLGCVLGPPVSPSAIDIAGVEGGMAVNGEPVGAGRGGDIMGHPLEALAWLANSLAQRGQGITAGEFVSLGSLVQTVWVDKGDVVTIDIVGLGKATARFD